MFHQIEAKITTLLKLNEFSHNHHLSNMKMLAKNSRRGILKAHP